MITMIATTNHGSVNAEVDNRKIPRDENIGISIGGKLTDEARDDEEVPLSAIFFAEQSDLVKEIFSFLDPPSLLKLCRGMPFVSPVLTHKHVIRSVANTLMKDTFDQNNQCFRRNRHRYRHIQYHKIVVQKMIPNFEKQASTGMRQSPMQLLRSVSGRYCERCQLDLICVSGW